MGKVIDFALTAPAGWTRSVSTFTPDAWGPFFSSSTRLIGLHRSGRVGAEPVGKYTARRPSADDHVGYLHGWVLIRGIGKAGSSYGLVNEGMEVVHEVFAVGAALCVNQIAALIEAKRPHPFLNRQV